MSDSGEGSSCCWEVVDHHGDITDEDSVSTTSSLEIVNADEEEDDVGTSAVTPVTGSPVSVGPRFILRLPSQQIQDDDDEDGGAETTTSTSMSELSGPSSSLTDTDNLTTESASSIDTTPTQASAFPTQVTPEVLEDLRRTLESLKTSLQPTGVLQCTARNEEDVLVKTEDNSLTSTMDGQIESDYSMLEDQSISELENQGDISQLNSVEDVPEASIIDDDTLAAAAAEEEEEEIKTEEDQKVARRGEDWKVWWITGIVIGAGIVVVSVMYFLTPSYAQDCAQLKHLSQRQSERYHTLSEKYTELTQNYKVLERSYQELIQDNTGLRKEKVYWDLQINLIKQEFDNKKEQVDDLLTDLRDMQSENADLKAENEKLAEQLKVALAFSTEESRRKRSTEPINLRDQCPEYITALQKCREDIEAERVRFRGDLDSIKAAAAEDVTNIRTQCQKDLDRVHGQFSADIETIRTQYLRDDNLQSERQQHRTEVENAGEDYEGMSSSRQTNKAADRFKSNEQTGSHSESSQKPSQTGSHSESTKKPSQTGSHSESSQRSHQTGSHSESSKRSQSDDRKQKQSGQSCSGNFWTETVLDMLNKTRGQIESTWEKVKNMSESLWNKHQPTLTRLHDKFAKKVQHLGDKLQENIEKKFNKWFKKSKKNGNEGEGPKAKTTRRDFKASEPSHAESIREQIVKVSHRISELGARRFYRDQSQATVLNIQRDLERINSLAVPAHKHGDDKNSLSNEQMKWLTCQLQWWNVLGTVAVEEDCVQSLCCWQVKIYGGNVKQCRQTKRHRGMVEDSCSLELTKSGKSKPVKRKHSESSYSENVADDSGNWYFERAEDRQFQRSEPDTWFFRRKNRRNNYWRNRWMYSPHMPHGSDVEPMYCHFDPFTDGCLC